MARATNYPRPLVPRAWLPRLAPPAPETPAALLVLLDRLELWLETKARSRFSRAYGQLDRDTATELFAEWCRKHPDAKTVPGFEARAQRLLQHLELQGLRRLDPPPRGMSLDRLAEDAEDAR